VTAIDQESGAAWVRELRTRIRGEVLDDGEARQRCATDQSLYAVTPRVVVTPRDEEEVGRVLALALEVGVPITPRAGGSGTAGAALGRGIVLRFGKEGPMNRLLSLTSGSAGVRATVEPGLLHDDLQRALRAVGVFLPADPSSGGICLLGGNLATKASGPHELRHGSIDRYTESLRLVTAAGTVIDTAAPESIPRALVDGLRAIRRDLLASPASHERLLARLDRKIASGYNLFGLLRSERPQDWVTQLLIGSVGTLGVITRATLRAEPAPVGHATTLLYFRDLAEAGDAVPAIAAGGAAAIEIINYRTIQIVTARHPELAVPSGEVQMLLVENVGPERHDQIDRVGAALRSGGYRLAAPPRTVEAVAEQEAVWKLRKALLPTIRNFSPEWRAPAIVNDVGVAVSGLAPFIRDVEGIFDRLGLPAAIYGHAGSGNLHLRPFVRPDDPQLRDLLHRLADEVYGAAMRYDGTITAEHGMGRARAPYLALEWGEALTGLMRRVKELFDPTGILNPGAVFPAADLTDDLRPL
jgi:FAD/FMN-containing dehydrogenase